MSVSRMAGKHAGFSDLFRLRRWNGYVLLVVAVLELGYGVLSWQYLSLIDAEAAGVDAATLNAQWLTFTRAQDRFMNAYAVIGILGLLLSGTWIYGAVKNARLLDPGKPRISPGMAIGWHLVPLANLIMPYRAMVQTYNSSVRPPRALTDAPPPVFPWWWGLWLLTTTVATVSIWLSSGDEADQLIASWIDVINATPIVASVYLWWRVIDLLTDLQMAAGSDAAHSNKEVIQ